MSERKIRACDSCGQYEEISKTMKLMQGRLFAPDKRTSEIHFDLCPDCWKKLGIKSRVRARRGRRPKEVSA